MSTSDVNNSHKVQQQDCSVSPQPKSISAVPPKPLRQSSRPPREHSSMKIIQFPALSICESRAMFRQRADSLCCQCPACIQAASRQSVAVTASDSSASKAPNLMRLGLMEDLVASDSDEMEEIDEASTLKANQLKTFTAAQTAEPKNGVTQSASTAPNEPNREDSTSQANVVSVPPSLYAAMSNQ